MMKKYTYSLILLMLTINGYTQQLKFTVLDAVTNETLPYANIYFIKSGVGNSTNLNGIALFDQSKLVSGDSARISSIGFETQFWPYVGEKDIIVRLSSSSKLLTQVVVNYVKPPKPEKVIKMANKNSLENYGAQPKILTSYYRETVQENGKYIQLNEAVVKNYCSGYPQKKLDKKIWRDWYYDESYVFELEGNRYFYPLLKDFNTTEDHQQVLASRRSENWSKFGIETTLIGEPMLLLAFDKIKYQYDFFNPAVWSKYQFKHHHEETIGEEKCYVISFWPKQTDRKFGIDQSRKNKTAIYVGRMYISKDTYALLKFEYNLAVDRDYGFFQKRMPLEYMVEINYEKRGEFYTISNIKHHEVKKVGEDENNESILHKATKELMVSKIDFNNALPFEDSTRFKSTRFSSIRHYANDQKSNPAEVFRSFKNFQPDQKIVADLERECSLDEQFERMSDPRKEELPFPEVNKQQYTFNYHDSSVVDSLHWMALANHQFQLKSYVLEENNYAKNELIEDKKYQKKLFDQLNNFYEQSNSVEVKHLPGSFFVNEDSLGTDIYSYQKDSVQVIDVLNLTKFDQSHPNTFIKRMVTSPSKDKILLKYEKMGVIGDFALVYPFGGNIPIDSMTNVYTSEWLSDSSLMYSKTNQLGSSRTLWSRNVNSGNEKCVYTELDSTFDVAVIKSRKHLYCTLQSKTENEIYLIENGQLRKVWKRQSGVEVSLYEGEELFLLINNENSGSFITKCNFQNLDKKESIAENQKGEYIFDIMLVKDRLVSLTYNRSVPELKYLSIGDKKWGKFPFDLGIGQYSLGQSNNGEDGFSFYFSSPSHPVAKYEYNFTTGELKQISKPTSVKPQYYKYCSTKRIWAKGHDGTKIPVTLIKNRAAGNRGVILRTYGAYGGMTNPGFDATTAILLNEGYTIAYAHVRGESILGPNWYKQGRQLLKKNSVLDYLSCAEYLIKKNIATPANLIGYGNSAGGIVVGQAINIKPELFNTVILDHPYLDVVNTMMNDALPLTIDEYKEWGNPNNKIVFDYINEYSPYQNISPKEYPNVLLVASYYDYQTPLWQIAKYTAKLRENNQSNSKVLMLTDMNSGHAGNTTGKEWMKLFAEMYSFVKVGVQ